MKKSKYFSEAAHLANQKFAGVDGFNNMSGAYRFAGADGSANNVQNYDASSSAPYEVTVTNANTTATAVKLFDSYNARTADNFDNVSGITIASAVPGVTYTALLAQSESKNFECGMTYIQVVSGSNAALTATWLLTTKDASGKLTSEPKTPKKSPNQNQSDVLQFNNVFKINGFTKIEFTMPASTAVTYSFYPSATVDQGRALGNVDPIMGYKAPVIGTPQIMQLDASTMPGIN